MKRELIYILAAAAVLISLAGCSASTSQSSAASMSQPDNASAAQSTQVPPAASTAAGPGAQVKTKATDVLMEYYAEDQIGNISVQSRKIEVDIKSSVSATDARPDDWDDTITSAETACSSLLDIFSEDDISNVVVYVIDNDDNNLLSVLNGKASYDVFGETDTAISTDNPPTISLDEFNAIKTGMTYQEVFDIVGARGTLLSESDIGLGDEYYTAMFSWDGEGSLGANANVMFQGGKVISKAQYGLG